MTHQSLQTEFDMVKSPKTSPGRGMGAAKAGRPALPGQVVLVDPIHEERVRDLEVHSFQGEFPRQDGAEPRVVGLRARELVLDPAQDLLPHDRDLIRGYRQDGHIQHPF